MKLRGAAGALVATWLLSACAGLAPQRESGGEPSQQAWIERRTRLNDIQQFTLRARIASGPLGVKASLVWRQRPTDFDLRMSGPFGAGGVLITGDERWVSVRTADDQFSTDDPQGYLDERFGWSLPVEDLRWWALGMPAPGTPSQMQVNDRGQVIYLNQSGWELEYGEYQAVNGLDLPRRFNLVSRAGNFRVIADEWADVK